MLLLYVPVPQAYVCEGRYHDIRLTRKLVTELLRLDERPTCVLLPDVSPDGLLRAMNAVLAQPPRPRALRDTFDYRRRTDACRFRT